MVVRMAGGVSCPVYTPSILCCCSYVQHANLIRASTNTSPWELRPQLNVQTYLVCMYRPYHKGALASFGAARCYCNVNACTCRVGILIFANRFVEQIVAGMAVNTVERDCLEIFVKILKYILIGPFLQPFRGADFPLSFTCPSFNTGNAHNSKYQA